MIKILLYIATVLVLFTGLSFGQTDEWETDYTVFDDGTNGPGDQVSSVAVVAPDRFVALVTETPENNLFTPPGNYLVGYWDADSGAGRVLSPINKEDVDPGYGGTGKFTIWVDGLDEISLMGAWQIVGDDKDRVYMANNGVDHNILVFKLTDTRVETTPYRMETGSENIFAIDIDTAGFVYVVDYEGNGDKTNEVKVFAGIDAEGTNWEGFGTHNDAPKSTIDLPEGVYQGIAVSDDGSTVYVSATSERSIWKYTGDPLSGYTKDETFNFTLAKDDTISNGGSGTPSVLGLGYMQEPGILFAACDSFIHIGIEGGYPYGRIYAIDAQWGTALDTIDIAEWNFAITGAYDTGSNKGRAGGFTSVADLSVEPVENAVYTQTYFGWAVEKWVFDGNLDDIVGAVEKIGARIPDQFQLKQNYPNPFNPSTSIEFDLNQSEFITLEIFNTLGQKVAILVQDNLSAGSYKVDFDASDFPSGIYFYQLKSGSFRAVKKMTLTK